MSDLTPFRIEVPDTAVADLRDRLARTRFPENETVDDWSQGVPLAYFKEIVTYWRDQYDMQRIAERLNPYPQFKTTLDGLGIHFLHIHSPEANALPLIMTHGWPGSVVEFLKVVGPLTDPAAHGGAAADAFHLILPTLPGYGFSDRPTAPGWTVEKTAGAWAQLMARLGYGQYVAQGGDWGAVVTAKLAAQDPEHCQAFHLNMVVAPPPQDMMTELSPLEERALAAMAHYQAKDSGYSKQQSTRPQTLGYGLADSPSGQAAWILEKFWAWTDCDGHPENVLSRDEMLDDIMMYWLTNSGASSGRLYWESFGAAGGGDPITTPMGGSVFPKEIFQASRRWAEARFPNIIHWNELDKGGHFAAFEQPEVFVNEVRTCFRTVR